MSCLPFVCPIPVLSLKAFFDLLSFCQRFILVELFNELLHKCSYQSLKLYP